MTDTYRPPICPLCGNYTRDRANGGAYCVCGWSIDKNGDEDFDPTELDMYDDTQGGAE